MSHPVHMMGLVFQLTQSLVYLLLQCFMLAAADSKGKDRGMYPRISGDFCLIVYLHCFPLINAAVRVTEPQCCRQEMHVEERMETLEFF